MPANGPPGVRLETAGRACLAKSLEWATCAAAVSNTDGRTDAPVIGGRPIPNGT